MFRTHATAADVFAIMTGMEGLRPDQIDRLARHRERALDVLLTTSAAYEGAVQLRETPEGKTLLAQPPEVLVSVAISTAAAAVERRRLQQAHATAGGVVRLEAADVFPSEVLGALKRRRLPFGAADVELLLDLGTSTMDRERVAGRSFETLSFAVTAATHLLRDEPARARLLGALERAAQALGALELPPTSDAAELRQRLQALLAANVPGGLLDFSVLDERDAWAKVAEEVLRSHAERWDGVQQLVALFARARSARPTVAWRREAAAAAARYEDFGALVRELLEPILRIDLSTSGIKRPPGWLLAPGNQVVAKGAIWSTAVIDERWVVPLLGRLALRAAAAAPHPGVTTALAHTLASASIEALAAIGTPDAEAELRALLAEIRRRDLLKRIAAIVGEPAAETRARDERIRREKRRAVERKAAQEPRERQQLASRSVRRDLAPRLRAAGFADSAGRTFWRDLDDRVETLHCKAGSAGLTLELGIWFRFVPRPSRVPERDGRPRPPSHVCDLRGNIPTWYDELDAAGATAERWFARWRPLPAVLRWLLVGKASEAAFGPGAAGSPQHTLLTGYVARELGEETVARKRLAQAAVFFRESLEERDDVEVAQQEPERAAWVERIEADAAR
jgi:hypothetical protein